MPSDNLTRDEARQRAALLKVESYTVFLDLTTGDETFESTTEVHVDCRDPGATTFLELAAESVESVTLNGVELDPDTCFADGRLRLEGLESTNQLRVAARLAYSRTGEGLHRFVDPADSGVYLYTQFEPYDAHRMYACFDQPDLKATFTLSVQAPPEWTVISNAPVARRAAGRWDFAPTARISPYITALVAGPYHEVHSRHGEVDLGLFCRRSLAAHLDTEELFSLTAAGLDHYARLFGIPYPFGKYDQLFVPEFNMGAMENAGCVTFHDDLVFRARVTGPRRERRALTVLHEMAHMWFGDLVTMRWWDDLWLNESFADWAGTVALVEATDYSDAWATFCLTEKTWAYRADQLSSTHPIVADAPDVQAARSNFDGITYAKGASVLKQLVAWVGEQTFTAGLRPYIAEHSYGNAEFANLLASLALYGGRDLDSWSKLWLQTPGVNTLTAEVELAPDGTYQQLTIRQDAPMEHPTLRPHRVGLGLYDLRAGVLDRRMLLEIDVEGERTEVPQLRGVPAPDLLLVNDDDLAYAKVRLDARSLATIRDHLGAIPTVLARVLCWTTTWDMTRDAELPARDFLAQVEQALPGEPDVRLVTGELGHAVAALDSYLDPELRPSWAERLATLSRRGMINATAGSDHQLAFAHAFAALARSDDDLDLVLELLSGHTVAPGLAVDVDLRWRLITALARSGRLETEQIDEELTRDHTAAGQRWATTASVSRPDPEVKESAWRDALATPGLANHHLEAIVAGFWSADQLDLLAGYAHRYFQEISGVFATRSPEMALRIAHGLFPSLVVAPETIAGAELLLADPSTPGPLRRVLQEGRDGLVRALRARERDRAAGSSPPLTES